MTTRKPSRAQLAHICDTMLANDLARGDSHYADKLRTLGLFDVACLGQRAISPELRGKHLVASRQQAKTRRQQI